MIKITLYKFSQKGFDMYGFFADPNIIYNKSNFKNIVDDESIAQRPYTPSRVKGIEKYILGEDTISKKTKLTKKAKGLIPNSIILNIPSKYLINDSLELGGSEKDIEILDGQHRLLAFNDKTKKILGDYTMSFIAFFDLDEDMKKEVFMVLNERQKNVDKNIMLRHKKLLNIISEDDELIINLIYELSDIDNSPFKGKIIKSGEQIKYGLKISQLEDVMKRANFLSATGILDKKGEISDKGFEAILNFFNSWKDTFKGAWFENSSTLTKIAGIRLVVNLFSSYIQVIINHFDKDVKYENFKIIIEYIKDEYFNDTFNVNEFDEKYKNAFRERSATEKLAAIISADILDHYKIEGEVFFK